MIDTENNYCIGNTINTYNGHVFDFANPQPDQIDIEDIAQALSNTCRWGGHCQFYSVAEHCVYASYEVTYADKENIELQMAMLLHDAAEAYMGDMPKPLKIMLSQFSDLEDKLEAIITKKYGCECSHEDIKLYDLMMFKKERQILFHGELEETPELELIPYCNHKYVQNWEPVAARKQFMNRYEQLKFQISNRE